MASNLIDFGIPHSTLVKGAHINEPMRQPFSNSTRLGRTHMLLKLSDYHGPLQMPEELDQNEYRKAATQERLDNCAL